LDYATILATKIYQEVVMAFKRIIPAILLIFLFLPLGTSGCSAGKNAPRPNFLIIITDDQREDTMEYMPKAQAGIFDEGVTFSKGYITTPFCCPSRSSIFTGMYAHNHNVLQNNMPFNIQTIAVALQKNGYYTGLIAKYLNSWEARPEYNYWVAFKSGETNYKDPVLNVNGTWNQYPGYITYILSDYVIDFLGKAPASLSHLC
jgi:hypothetical protein